MLSNPVTERKPPLLKTKISIPRLPGEFIHRPRLTERIHQGVKGPLTLIAAPAGFGKTNLLIEWTKETTLPVAWLSIDNDDNDTSRFIRYAIGALQTLVPRFGEEALALDLLQSPQGDGWKMGLTLLINELAVLPKEIVLVYDDFHVLENPVIVERLDFFLKHSPPNFHLIIASRSEPTELDMAFLRAKGRVFELGMDDLRFTGEELVQYFQQTIGLELTPEMAQLLEERTDGWITSLQLAAISLKDQADPSTLLANLESKAHYLSDFLAEEVLDRQPGEVRQFLLRTSILETFNGPLCEAVVKPNAQPGYGAVMLNRLEHANLFVTALDEKRESFRYHPLFADFLREVQRQVNPAEIPELHKRAATWLEGNGHFYEAFRHALDSRDMTWAANLIERNVPTMINRGEMSILARWIGRLPEEITHKRPLLSLGYAWALIVTQQLDLARYWLEDVERSVERLEKETQNATPSKATGSTDGLENVDVAGIRGGLALCQSYLAMLRGDMVQAAKFSRQATRYLSKENVYLRSFVSLEESISLFFSGETQKAIESLRITTQIARQANNPVVMIIAACEVAIAQHVQGQLSKSWETLQKARYLAIGRDGKPHPLSSFIDIIAGEILLERNVLEEANDYLERGVRVTQTMWYLGSLGGMTYLARVRQALGDGAGAQEVVEDIARMALRSDTSQWDNALAAALAVRLAVQRGDLETAEPWWKKGGFPDLSTPLAIENYPYHIFEYLALSQARFLIVRGQETGRTRDIKQSLELLGILLAEAERFQRGASQIQILILQAMAQSALGNERATKTLLHALALGEPEGFRRFYLDEGWRLADLLRQCRAVQEEADNHLPSVAFINSLLESIQGAGNMEQVDQESIEGRAAPTIAHLEDGLPISLSAREMEVLALIAEGKSNQEISAELYLALNTVKRHAYNIYTKLEVKKRTHAVSRARQLGLIP
jgi:LuxR family maltose regulon positive regulatory protein